MLFLYRIVFWYHFDVYVIAESPWRAMSAAYDREKQIKLVITAGIVQR